MEPEKSKRKTPIKERYITAKQKITSGLKTRSKSRLNDKGGNSSGKRSSKPSKQRIAKASAIDSASESESDSASVIEVSLDQSNVTHAAGDTATLSADLNAPVVGLGSTTTENQEINTRYDTESRTGAFSGFSEEETIAAAKRAMNITQRIENDHGSRGENLDERDGSDMSLPITPTNGTNPNPTDTREGIRDGASVERECKEITSAISTFRGMENCSELNTVIGPTYDVLRERISALSDQIVFLGLIDKYHQKITSLTEELGTVKVHLEHTARRSRLRDSRKSSTLPAAGLLDPVSNIRFNSQFARHLSESEKEAEVRDVFRSNESGISPSHNDTDTQGDSAEEDIMTGNEPGDGITMTTQRILSEVDTRLTRLEGYIKDPTRARLSQQWKEIKQEYEHARGIISYAAKVAEAFNIQTRERLKIIEDTQISLNTRLTAIEMDEYRMSKSEIIALVAKEMTEAQKTQEQQIRNSVRAEMSALNKHNGEGYVVHGTMEEQRTEPDKRVTELEAEVKKMNLIVSALLRSRTPSAPVNQGGITPPSTPLSFSMPDSRPSSVQSVRGQEFNRRKLEKMVEKINRAVQVRITPEADISEVRKHHQVSAPKLQKVVENLNKVLQEYVKGDEFDAGFYQVCITTADTAEEWIEGIEDRYDQLDVHTVDNEKNRSNIDVSVFTGDHKQTIHEFIEEFEIAYNNVGQSKRRAGIMHSKHLSPMIKSRTLHASHDYPQIKKWLIDQYGDAITIVNILVASLECIRKPGPNAHTERLSFYLNISNILMRLERMKTSSPIPAEDIDANLQSRQVLERMISIIPDHDEVKLSDAIRERGLDTRKPQGPYTLKVYSEFVAAQVDNAQRALERAAKNPAPVHQNQTQNQNRSKPRNTNAAATTVQNTPQYSGATAPSQQSPESEDECYGHPPMTFTVVGPGEKWWTNGRNFPCPMIGHDHELNTCKDYFTLTPAERRSQAGATGRRICWCCLRPTSVCNKTCMRSTVVPEALKCKECAKVAVPKGLAPLNVLFCVKQEHDSSKPPAGVIMRELKKYLKGMPKMADEMIVFANFGFVALIDACGCTADACTHHTKTLSSPKTDGSPPVIDTRTGERNYDMDHQVPPTPEHDAFFLMQWIKIGESECLVLFDRGSNVNIISGPLAEREGLQVISSKPSSIRIVGGEEISTQYGQYRVVLGNKETGYHTLVCHGMPQVTTTFNKYALHEINTEARAAKDVIGEFEPLPPVVGGGPAHLLIGIKDIDLDPKFIAKLGSGVGVYRSPFLDRFGSSICYGGSHESFSQTNEAQGNQATLAAMFTHGLQVLKSARSEHNQDKENTMEVHPMMMDSTGGVWEATPLSTVDIVDLGCEPIVERELTEVERESIESRMCAVHKATIPISRMRQLIDQDDISDTVAYRCPECSACLDCKKSNKEIATGIENSVGQMAIDKSTHIIDGLVWVDLPFIIDPDQYLTQKHHGTDNYKQALKVFQTQCKKPDNVKKALRAVHNDLVQQGFISRLTELPEDIQKEIAKGPFWHYNPWRGVWKEGSESTPLRMVVDPTMTGLNSCLPKGENNLGKMNDIVIATRVTPYAWATDIKKMYNQLRLMPSSMRFQLMLYDDTLSIDKPPEVWVMTRAWYGETHVGNQAGTAVTTLVDKGGDDFPMAVKPLTKNRFVDDVMSGGTSKAEREEQIEQSKLVLDRGGFSLKYIIRSGEAPPDKASNDGSTVKMLGYRYETEADTLSLGFRELNMNKKVRGAKKPNVVPVTTKEEAADILQPIKITRRTAMSKLAEFYDPIGIFEPLKLQYKLKLSQLNEYEWDDPIDEDLQREWKESLSQLMDLTELEVPRCIIPIDESNKPIRLICLSDAGAAAGGAVVYAGVQMDDGSYTCGMVTAKSKLMDATIPRNELSAIMLMTELAFIVKRAVGDRVTEILYATDSSIALSWCHNTTIKLRLFVHNRVETIRRMIQWTTDSEDIPLYHIDGTRNLADLLTKKHDLNTTDVSAESQWQQGATWMTEPTSALPLREYGQMNIPKQNKDSINAECYDDPYFLKGNDVTHTLLINELDRKRDDTDERGNYPGVGIEAVNATAARPDGGPPKGERTPFMIDLIRLGWFRAKRVIGVILKFKDKLVHRIRHRTKEDGSKKIEGLEECNQCIESNLNQYDMRAEEILFRHETKMIIMTVPTSKLTKFTMENDILIFTGRLSEENPFRFRDLDEVPFLDAPQIIGAVPVVMAESEVYYSYLMAIHTRIAPHAGVVTTMKEVGKKMFVPNNPKRIVKKVRQDCTRCKIILKQTVELEMQKHSFARTMIAPPFYNAMMDIVYGFPGQPFKKARKRIKVYALCIVCLLTGATSIQAMEGVETQDVILALEMHARTHGVPAEVFVDNGTQLIALKHASFNLRDVHAFVYDAMGMTVTVSAAKSHEERGRVERRIGLIRDMLSRTIDPTVAQTPLQWHALFAKIANSIDDLPLAKGNPSNSNELGYEILTANRIKMGRNNNRSLTFPGMTLDMAAGLTCMLEKNRKMYQVWYQIFMDHVHLLTMKPDKWNVTSKMPQEGDVVLFVQNDSGYTKASKTWKLGKIVEVIKSRVKILSFTKNARRAKAKGSVFERNVREVSILFSLDELYVNSRGYFQKLSGNG